MSNSFGFRGEGTPKAFQITLDNDSDQTLLGGLGKPPFGTAHIYGYWPGGGRTVPELFFLVNGDAYTFYPASDFPAIGACGQI
jgi:hypothetical protein